jgi:hypothetical protein
MKKISSLLALLFVVFLTSAQVPPQGINYQAVALNGSGTPVASHSVSLRLSVLDSSASGAAVYVETQSAMTDPTGLLAVVIGHGTAVTGTFSGINWGSNNKWLKVEIDITGGTSYTLMGTSQFMSVPYALYAAQASPSSPSFEYPDGTDSITPVFLGPGFNYTVPAGKNLYISSLNGPLRFFNSHLFFLVNHDTLNFSMLQQYQFPLTFSAGTLLTSDSVVIFGFLANKKVDWVYVDPAATFTVPTGKMLFVSQLIGGGAGDDVLTINGTLATNLEYYTVKNPIIIDQSQTIGFSTIQRSKIRLLGYLKNR